MSEFKSVNRDDLDPSVSSLVREIPALYRYALALTDDADAAELLVGDTISKAWEKIGTFRGESSIKTWLHRILHNLAVDNFRQKSNEVSVEQIEEQWMDGEYSVDPVRLLETAEEREEIKDSLLRLPFAYRSVVVLHDVEGWKLSEVASSLQITLPAAKQRLRRGRMMMVSALSESSQRKEANKGVPLSCWQARSMVSDYIDGEISGTKQLQLEEHLRLCSTCPPLYASLVGVKSSLSSLRDPDSVIPPEVARRIKLGVNSAVGGIK